jgi:hypothetical protein
MRRGLLLAAALAVLVAGCGSNARNGASRPAHASRVTDLHDIAQLRSTFTAHDGTPRLLVLASPT